MEFEEDGMRRAEGFHCAGDMVLPRGGNSKRGQFFRRLTALLLCVALVLSLAVPGEAVQAKEEQEKEQGVTLVCTGTPVTGEVELLIRGSGFKDIMEFDLSVSYDASFLTLSGYEYEFLGDQVQGVHAIFDDSENGRASLSVFTNDGNLTIGESDVLRLVFHTLYAGQMDLSFGLEVKDCRDKQGRDVPVRYSESLLLSVEGDADVSYDCGLVGVRSVSAGADTVAEFCLFQQIAVVRGSFQVTYDPERIRYVSCISRQEDVEVSVVQTDAKTLQVSFWSKTEGKAMSAGTVLELHMVPIRNNSTAVLAMSGLSLEDQYTNLILVTANSGFSMRVSGGNTSNQFILSSPTDVYEQDTLDVGLAIRKNEGFNILDGEITYDPKVLEYKSAKFMDSFSAAYNKTVMKTEDGRLRIQILAGESLADSGQILTCSFRVKEKDKALTYVQFSMRAGSDSFGNLPPTGSFVPRTSNSDGVSIRLLGIRPATPASDDKKDDSSGTGTDGKKDDGSGTGTNDKNGSGSGTGTNADKAPAAVKLVSVTAAAASVKVKWKKVSGADGYDLMRKVSGGKYTRISRIKKASTVSYTDKSVKDGTLYSYKVLAYKGTATGKAANVKTILWLKKPAIKSAASKKSKTILVKAAKNKKASGYQIQLCTSSNFKSIAKTVKVSSAKAVSTTIKGLKKGKKYYVRLRTYKKSGSKTYYSVWSGKKTVKTV